VNEKMADLSLRGIFPAYTDWQHLSRHVAEGR